MIIIRVSVISVVRCLIGLSVLSSILVTEDQLFVLLFMPGGFLSQESGPFQ
jgi:hypothetical protein